MTITFHQHKSKGPWRAMWFYQWRGGDGVRWPRVGIKGVFATYEMALADAKRKFPKYDWEGVL